LNPWSSNSTFSINDFFIVFRLTFSRVIRKKSTEEFSCAPYIIALLNCLLYTWYGLPVVSHRWENLPLVTTNGLGILLEFSFIFIYFWFASDGGKASFTFQCLTAKFFQYTWYIMIPMQAWDILDIQVHMYWFRYLWHACCICFSSNVGFLFAMLNPSQVHAYIQSKSALMMYEFREGSDEGGCVGDNCYHRILHHCYHLSSCFPWSPSSKGFYWEYRNSGLCSNVRFSTGGCGESSLISDYVMKVIYIYIYISVAS
jgi:uncharacterized protein with PQ loop repeat